MTVAKAKLDKVVIHKRSGISKGYCEPLLPGADATEVLRKAMDFDWIRIRPEPASAAEQVFLNDAKALFFVASFAGDKKKQTVLFHRNTAVSNGIWVRVEFEDGEMMEGLIHNSAAYLIQNGFFMLTTDPGSNNELVYVFKSALKDFRVLGTRAL